MSVPSLHFESMLVSQLESSLPEAKSHLEFHPYLILGIRCEEEGKSGRWRTLEDEQIFQEQSDQLCPVVQLGQD